MRLAAIAIAACLSIVELSVASDAQAAITKPTHIPAQRLDLALQMLAKQRGLAMAYRSEVVGNRQTAGASGDLTRDEALTQLLSGTGLSYQFLDDNTVTIIPTPTGRTSLSSKGEKAASQTDEDSTQDEQKAGGSFPHGFRLAQVDQGTPTSSASVGNEKPDEQASHAELEEIVVSASKRADETLKETPGALTVLTGKTLDKLGIVDFQDYLPYVPGLSSSTLTIGSPGNYKAVLRGLNSGASATVGYYLDDTTLTPSSPNSIGGSYSPDPALADVERIEVLKGPQATLYGASTLGGIIKIISKKPDLTTFGGDVSVSGVTVEDGGSGYSARGAVNLPLIQNTLAARVSAYDREDPGFTDNVLTGQNNINRDYAHGGQLALRYVPTEKLTFDLTGLIQELSSSGNTMEFLDQQTLRPIYGYGKYSTLSNTTASTQLTVFSLSANYDTGWGTLT
ncbi:MAG: TonB-dependent receptor plug domain-containing protein, partial [Steroidobacteraceae bacterium]